MQLIKFMNILNAHWQSIAWILGAWAALATVLIRVIPKPTKPRVWVLVHAIVLDWPAALPALDFKGVFGLPVNVPFLTLSQVTPRIAPKDKGIANSTLLLWMGLVSWFYVCLFIFVPGCASGTDGLRQACAATDNALMASYSAATAVYKADQVELRSTITTANFAPLREKLTAHTTAFGDAINGLDGIAASTKAICDLAPAIDAGLKKDVPTLMAQVIALTADVQKVIEVFKGML